jgi:hypothetical protein
VLWFSIFVSVARLSDLGAGEARRGELPSTSETSLIYAVVGSLEASILICLA